MKPKSLLLFIILSVIITLEVRSQRNYYFFDSTNYAVDQNYKLIASKFKLYAQEDSQLKELKDFKSIDTNYYIRDVDFLDRHTIWVLIGRNTIGYPTQLFKSNDGGIHWIVDSSFYNVSEHRSLNQMQVLHKDTLVLFDGYYQSDVLRSFDGGKSWHKWIGSLIAHYFQLHYCQQTSRYYMIGLPGDAFSSVSFEIPDSVWRNNYPYWMSGCHNNQPWCHRVFYGQNIWLVDFIKEHQKYIDSICINMPLNLQENLGSNQPVPIFPNPATNYLVLEGLRGLDVLIYDAWGKLVLTAKCDHANKIDIQVLTPGLYFLKCQNQVFKFLKQSD